MVCDTLVLAAGAIAGSATEGWLGGSAESVEFFSTCDINAASMFSEVDVSAALITACSASFELASKKACRLKLITCPTQRIRCTSASYSTYKRIGSVAVVLKYQNMISLLTPYSSFKDVDTARRHVSFEPALSAVKKPMLRPISNERINSIIYDACWGPE